MFFYLSFTKKSIGVACTSAVSAMAIAACATQTSSGVSSKTDPTAAGEMPEAPKVGDDFYAQLEALNWGNSSEKSETSFITATRDVAIDGSTDRQSLIAALHCKPTVPEKFVGSRAYFVLNSQSITTDWALNKYLLFPPTGGTRQLKAGDYAVICADNRDDTGWIQSHSVFGIPPSGLQKISAGSLDSAACSFWRYQVLQAHLEDDRTDENSCILFKVSGQQAN